MSVATHFDSAYDFEKIVGMEYERMGFEVKLNTKQNEPGYDFLAMKNHTLIAVQVKNYKRKVPINVVSKFRDYMDTSNIKYGAIISSKGFSPAAIAAIDAEKIKNFQMGHFHGNKIKWDYIGSSFLREVDHIEATKPHYISVFTAKGGVGKTIISSHLAGAFALSGYRVHIVDGDPEENLHRLTGDTAIVPNSRAGKNNAIKVSKIKNWSKNQKNEESITVFDCSPAFERNSLELLEKTESFIIPTSLSPLEVGNKAEVLLRTIKQIRNCNKEASIFIVLNKYTPPTKRFILQFKKISKIIMELGDKKCSIVNPKEANIRYSKILTNWGVEPDLSFKSIAGRCYPRDDFLNLSEYLLERININQQ